MPKIVDWYMDGKIDIDLLITHTMPVERINDAFDLMHKGKVDPQRRASSATTPPGTTSLPFPDCLRGLPAESVDFVMCTHLHVDHVGWNTKLENGRWVPTFPNARYLFAKREYAHWENERTGKPRARVNNGSFDDLVLLVVEAGKAVMIDSDHQPDPMLTIRDYPGHTPGLDRHQSRETRASALFSGDIMHHRSRSITPTGRASSAPIRTCRRVRVASSSRIALESNALLCPAHFRARTPGYIRAAGDRFRIEWDKR